jgi:hypothetical protein
MVQMTCQYDPPSWLDVLAELFLSVQNNKHYYLPQQQSGKSDKQNKIPTVNRISK